MPIPVTLRLSAETGSEKVSVRVASSILRLKLVSIGGTSSNTNRVASCPTVSGSRGFPAMSVKLLLAKVM